MKVKTITFTIEDRFDAEAIALDLQEECPELIAFEVKGPFEVKQVKPKRKERSNRQVT